MSARTVKEKVLQAVKELPDQSSCEDVMERIYFLYKVEKGIQQADSGQKVSHEEARARLKKWLE